MHIEHLNNPIELAVAGMRAHNRSVNTVYRNITNASVTDVGNGKPYRRQEPVFEMDENGMVRVEEFKSDMSNFIRVYQPSHPNADANGYVQMPNVNVATEMISLNEATRSYEANVAILKRYQQVSETALELLR